MFLNVSEKRGENGGDVGGIGEQMELAAARAVLDKLKTLQFGQTQKHSPYSVGILFPFCVSTPPTLWRGRRLFIYSPCGRWLRRRLDGGL